MSDPVHKVYRDGTHRIRHPEETLANLAPILSSIGITRVANVTGLDRIGIPVVMVVRPNSRSVSVSQGKGTTLSAAKASGIMESVESYVAETAEVIAARAALDAPPDGALVVDWNQLPRQSSGQPPPYISIGWSLGTDLLSAEPVWAPAELVHTNYTLPQPDGSGWFFASSNGLASGNNTEEAFLHAVCEVVERDCRTRWLVDERTRIGTRTNVMTIDDDGLQDLLERLECAGMEYGIWELTGPIGIPVFLCTIRERDGVGRLSAQLDSGSGCHPCREVALSRAITEAIQMRLTYLTGARDDQDHVYFGSAGAIGRGLSTRHEAAGKDFATVPSFTADTPAEDLHWVLERLRDYGIRMVFSFRFPIDPVFSPDGVTLAVVRVVVPSLLGPMEAYNRHLFGSNRIL